MRKERRLTRARDFAAVRNEGRAWSDRCLVVVVRPNDTDTCRVGYSVGKRLGNAVVRNRTKRRLREAVSLAPVKGGWDLVIIARQDAPDAGFDRICSSVNNLFRRAGILADVNGNPASFARGV